jgi:hypothetical protein
MENEYLLLVFVKISWLAATATLSRLIKVRAQV